MNEKVRQVIKVAVKEGLSPLEGLARAVEQFNRELIQRANEIQEKKKSEYGY